MGDIGRTSVKLLFEEWGWTADIVQSDYGEDLDCCVFSRGQRTSLQFRCQLKSASRPKRSRRGDYLVSVSATTCAAWIQSYQPVFLILYDRTTKEPCFINASALLRRNPKALTRRFVSFTIPKNAQLSQGRDVLVKEVQDHYAAFLRVSDAVLCVAFPILMPKYRAALPRTEFSIEDWEWETKHRDRLPAWAMVFETMDTEYLYAVQREFSGTNLDEIYADLARGLEKSAVVDALGQWLALSCCPIEFRAVRSDEPSFWTGELTGWRSFARIRNRIVDDRDYAFAPPAGFMTEVARHHLSWEGYFHVDPGRDLALQLYAAVPLTPAYRARSQSMRTNAAGQLLPWSCPLAQRAELINALKPSQLAFFVIDSFSTSNNVVGVIHNQLFVVRDDFTSIPMAKDWEAFDRGAIREIVDGLPQGTLPGSEAGTEVLKHVLKKIPGWIVDPAETFDGIQSDTPAGMPVNLAARKIAVERFHALSGDFDPSPCDDIAADLQRKVREAHPNLDELEVTFVPYQTELYSIVRLALSWRPPLHLSSAGAFLEVEDILLQEFDRILPRRVMGTEPHGTFEVVSFAGNIHFNPDYWDRWQVAGAWF